MGKPLNFAKFSNNLLSKSFGYDPQKLSKIIEGYIWSQGAMIPSLENTQYHNVESRMTLGNIFVESPDDLPWIIIGRWGDCPQWSPQVNLRNKGFERKFTKDMTLMRMNRSSLSTTPKCYRGIYACENPNTSPPNLRNYGKSYHCHLSKKFPHFSDGGGPP
jgi:hypothetical protein